MKYVMFTRRTMGKKLRWLQFKLATAGIRWRHNGRSFHAPILEVDETKIEEAWDILTQDIDDMDDNDEFFDMPPLLHNGSVRGPRFYL